MGDRILPPNGLRLGLREIDRRRLGLLDSFLLLLDPDRRLACDPEVRRLFLTLLDRDLFLFELLDADCRFTGLFVADRFLIGLLDLECDFDGLFERECFVEIPSGKRVLDGDNDEGTGKLSV